MSILGSILAFPLLGPVGGVSWIANQLLTQVENELYDEDAVRGQMVELELRYDLGELSEEAFTAGEDVLLERIKQIREHHAAQNG